MKKLMMITSNVESLAGDNGVKFNGQLDSAQPTFCHAPNRSGEQLYWETGSLFAAPTHQELQGRGASS